MSESSHIYRLSILNEILCLDFVNTVGWHESESPSEWLKDLKDLATWGVRTRCLTKEEAEELERFVEQEPSKAKLKYKQFIALREVMFRIFRAIVRGNPAPAEDLAALSSQFELYKHLTLVESMPGQFALRFSSAVISPLERMHGELVRSAVDLLLSKNLKYLKQCDGGECGWLFIDTSRNHSRRWCSMTDCGNRSKAKRHYRKKNSEHSN